MHKTTTPTSSIPRTMDTPTLVDSLNPPENLHQSMASSQLNTSSTRSDNRPAIRVLAGPLRLGSYQSFPILLDASDPLVQESETQDDHIFTLVSPQPPQRTSGVLGWTSRIKGLLSAFATRAVVRLRRVLDRE